MISMADLGKQLISRCNFNQVDYDFLNLNCFDFCVFDRQITDIVHQWLFLYIFDPWADESGVEM